MSTSNVEAPTPPTLSRRIVSIAVFLIGALTTCFLVGERQILVALPILVVLATMNIALAPRRLAAARFALWAGIAGVFVEMVLAMFHLTAFRIVSAKYPLMPPLWLLGLWSLFGSIVPTAFGPLQTRPKAAALIGALGAPLAYLAAVKLNALGFGVFGDSGPNPAISLIGIAIVWAGVLPGLLLLSRKIDRVADWAD